MKVTIFCLFIILMIFQTDAKFQTKSNIEEKSNKCKNLLLKSEHEGKDDVTYLSPSELKKRVKFIPTTIHPSGIPLEKRTKQILKLDILINKKGRVTEVYVKDGTLLYRPIARNIALVSKFQPLKVNDKEVSFCGELVLEWSSSISSPKPSNEKTFSDLKYYLIKHKCQH